MSAVQVEDDLVTAASAAFAREVADLYLTGRRHSQPDSQANGLQNLRETLRTQLNNGQQAPGSSLPGSTPASAPVGHPCCSQVARPNPSIHVHAEAASTIGRALHAVGIVLSSSRERKHAWFGIAPNLAMFLGGPLDSSATALLLCRMPV